MSEQEMIKSKPSAPARPDGTAPKFPLIILAFAIAFTAFVLGPPFLGYKFPPYPLMTVADVFDFFTPLVLVPLYWVLFSLDGQKAAGRRETLAFMVLAAFWVLGQGIHLAANSIGHLVKEPAGSGLYSLTYLYDEVLGHYLWHFGVMGLSALLIFRQWKTPSAGARFFNWQNVLSGALYGFTYFAMVIEGTTKFLGLPFAVLAVITGFLLWRNPARRTSLLAFFLLGYLVALVLFAVWGIWQGGLPEFSAAGLL